MKHNFRKGSRFVAFLLVAAMMLPMLPASIFSVFANGGEFLVNDYKELTEALSSARKNNSVIVIGDIVVPEGADLSVPKGVKLIIAYNDKGEYGGHEKDEYDVSAVNYDEKFKGDKPVNTLTLSKGASLTVYGSLIVGGQLVAAPGKEIQGATGNLYAKLKVDGKVDLSNGSLYCYGYIDGEGDVVTDGASNVYAPFVVRDFCGGVYVYGQYMISKQSALNDYIMPNIKAKLTVKYGSSVYGLCALYAGGAVNNTTPKLVGNSSALIILENSGSRIESKYIDNTVSGATLNGKFELDFYGDICLGSLELEIYYVSIDTSDVVFPVPYGFEVTINEGVFHSKNKFALLPGSELIVKNGGELRFDNGGGLLILSGMKQTPADGYHYPYTEELLANGYKSNGSITVEGSLNFTYGSVLAGVIDNIKMGGSIKLDANTKTSGVYSTGVFAAFTANFNSYSYYNKTEYSLTASALSRDGKLFNLVSGKTYYCADPSTKLDVNTYSYVYYGTSASDKKQTLNGNTKYTISGSMDTFKVIYNYNGGKVEETTSTTIKPNSNGMKYWFDVYSGEIVTAITANRFYMLAECAKSVTFDYNGEKLTLAIKADGKIPTPDFKKEHYQLSGWSTTEGGAVKYSLNAVADFESATLYPCWTPVKYTVKYGIDEENFAIYKGSYLYKENGYYVLKEEQVPYLSSANPPSEADMSRDKLNFEWKGDTSSIKGNTFIVGEYFEYGVKNLRTGIIHNSLSSAIEAALTGDTLRIQQSSEEKVIIPAGMELTIDMNGFILTNSNGTVITNKGKLTLVDSMDGGAVVQTGKGPDASNVFRAVVNEAGAVLVINGADITANADSVNTEALYNLGEVTLVSGVISSLAGNAVYNFKQDAKFTQKGGEILYNGSNASCYGVKNDNQATYILENGSIGAVNTSGKAFYNFNKSTLTIYNGSVTSNKAVAISNTGASVTIHGGHIETGAATQNIYAIENKRYANAIAAELNVYGGEIVATTGSRGVNNQKSTFNMYGGTVSALGMTTWAWGIYNEESAVFNMYGGKVFSKNNHAIYNRSTTKTAIAEVNVYGGHVETAGGATSYAIINAHGNLHGAVNIYGGSFGSNTTNAIFNTGSNGTVIVYESAAGGLYKFTDSPINQAEYKTSLSSVQIKGDGEYAGYYCMIEIGKSAVASVGSKQYGYISHALAEAKDGETVKLLSDATLNTLAYPKAKIDLNGFTLDLKANTLTCDTLYITNNGSVKGYSDEIGSTLLYSDNCQLVEYPKDGDQFMGYAEKVGSSEFIITPKNRIEFTLVKVYRSQIVYTVIFEDENGNIISEKKYHQGDVVTVPEGPDKAGDNTYKYTFAGWSPLVETTCMGDKVYTPSYTKEYIQYKVVFKGEDGSLIGEAIYHYGDAITPPEAPKKPSTDLYEYQFAGWGPDFTGVCNGNATYSATYTEKKAGYTVIFKDEDGKIISEKIYKTGTTIEIPSAPTKASDNTYNYTFKGWDSTVETVCNSDKTYTAVYEKTFIEYKVVFKNEDGTVLSEKNYHYGDTVTAPNAPVKASDNTYNYTFKGWDSAIEAVKGNKTYVAIYDKTFIEYKVVFKDEDGKVLSEKTYHYGDTVTVPASPSKENDKEYSYTFAGWDAEVETVCKGNKTYVAKYNKEKLLYIVGDTDGNNQVNKDDAIHLLMYTFYPDVYPVSQDCDFDGNGIVNKDDAIHLLMYTFYPDVYPLNK